MNDEKTVYDDGLTPKEREVLKLLAEGKTLKEIADVLEIKEEAARNHRKSLMKRLNVYNLRDLTQYAAQAGLVSAEDRFAKRLDVGLAGKAVFTTFGRPVESRVSARDLSAHGAYLVCGSSPEVGDPVEVSLHQEEPKIVCEAEGVVTRVDERSEDERGIAIEFQAIPDLQH